MKKRIKCGSVSVAAVDQVGAEEAQVVGVAPEVAGGRVVAVETDYEFTSGK